MIVSINKILKEIHPSSSIVLTILKFINYTKDRCLFALLQNRTPKHYSCRPAPPGLSAGFPTWWARKALFVCPKRYGLNLCKIDTWPYGPATTRRGLFHGVLPGLLLAEHIGWISDVARSVPGNPTYAARSWSPKRLTDVAMVAVVGLIEVVLHNQTVC